MKSSILNRLKKAIKGGSKIAIFLGIGGKSLVLLVYLKKQVSSIYYVDVS